MSPRPKKKRINFKRRERRARERREADEAFNHDARQAGQSAGAPSSLSVPDQLTPLGLPHSDPISQPCGPRCTRLSHWKVGCQPMIIRPSNLTRSLVNPQAYSQAYINRPFQTLSTTLGPTLLQRQARSQDLPYLPET